MNDRVITECSWIGNSPTMRPQCCQPVVTGRSYCEQHLWQVYQKGSALGKRKKDIKRAEAIWDIESELNAAVEELIEEGVLDL
jgi:hypothetical protein